jgi:hypothetical protein
MFSFGSFSLAFMGFCFVLPWGHCPMRRRGKFVIGLQEEDKNIVKNVVCTQYCRTIFFFFYGIYCESPGRDRIQSKEEGNRRNFRFLTGLSHVMNILFKPIKFNLYFNFPCAAGFDIFRMAGFREQ